MDRLKKTDRLIKLWLLILKNPGRYSTRDLAEKFNVALKTIYRDLNSLGLELEVPVYTENNKWVIDDKHFLPPVRFTKTEALYIFLAARLLAGYKQLYDPNIDSTFSTLASVMESPLKEQVQNTFDWLRRLPRDEKYITTMAKLAEAWTSLRSVRVMYRSYDKEQAEEKVLDPYFIEPVSSGMASYLLAFCHHNQAVRTYKVDRIESIQILEEHYSIPADFNPNNHLEAAMGIIAGDPVCSVRLKVSPDLARLMQETAWHQSQKVFPVDANRPEAGVIVTLKVAESVELVRWVLGWGSGVEVISPPSLRRAVTLHAQQMLQQYGNQMVLTLG